MREQIEKTADEILKLGREKCPRCKGRKFVWYSHSGQEFPGKGSGMSHKSYHEECPDCNGTGFIEEKAEEK